MVNDCSLIFSIETGDTIDKYQNNFKKGHST